MLNISRRSTPMVEHIEDPFPIQEPEVTIEDLMKKMDDYSDKVDLFLAKVEDQRYEQLLHGQDSQRNCQDQVEALSIAFKQQEIELQNTR
jgi:hypothetical protein